MAFHGNHLTADVDVAVIKVVASQNDQTSNLLAYLTRI